LGGIRKVKIYVAGHRGLVGSAIVRAIEAGDDHTWLGQTRQELDLLNRTAVFEYVNREKPDWVIIAAAKVGGIHANSTYPVEFLSENLQIETNLMDACHAANINRVLFLGSSCVYPKVCPQPIKEEYLLTGPLEPTNEAYALAKISGLKLIESYRKQYGHKWISAMPTNLYGPGDNYDLENSHVLPALIRKIHDAREARQKAVSLWGDGSPLREFLHSDDLARASLMLLNSYDSSVAINVGSGVEVSINELAQTIADIVGFKGEMQWDTSKPNGTPRKILDSSLIKDLGWTQSVPLRKGIAAAYEDFLERNLHKK
jgi:GDP-L-fucose synthase